MIQRNLSGFEISRKTPRGTAEHQCFYQILRIISMVAMIGIQCQAEHNAQAKQGGPAFYSKTGRASFLLHFQI